MMRTVKIITITLNLLAGGLGVAVAIDAAGRPGMHQNVVIGIGVGVTLVAMAGVLLWSLWKGAGKRILLIIPLVFLARPAHAAHHHDWKFIAAVGVEAGLYAWDMQETMNGFRNIPNFAETNSLYGSHPSSARLYGLGALVDAGYGLGSYELRHHGPRSTRRFWIAGIAYAAACHANGLRMTYGVRAPVVTWHPVFPAAIPAKTH